MNTKDPSIVESGKEVIQIAFHVPDLKAAMDWCSKEVGIGPWFVIDRIGCEGSTCRGQAAEAEFTIAVAVSGTMMIELVQTLDDKPSLYKEARERRGYGFHHVGKFRPDLSQLVETYEATGRSIIFQSLAPGAGNVFFVENGEAETGLIELIDDNETTRSLSNAMLTASLSWKGERPVRSFSELLA